MDITVISTDAIYQEEGIAGVTRHFDCDVICTTAEDPNTGEKSNVILIHDIEMNSVISIDAIPIMQAINIQAAKNAYSGL